jgi:enoyl-CoA hydratase/carnithine racemase
MTAQFSYDHLLVTVDGAAAHMTLDRPESSNALNDKLIDELRDFFVRLYWRCDIRVVLLAASGRNFCAGFDMKEHDGRVDPSSGAALMAQRKISEIVIAMRRCPQPIVALVNGAASGGGFALALASDVRIATPDTRMNAAFIRVGLSACDIGASYFLPRMVGASVASEYMLTGRFIHAERARELGLVSVIVDPKNLVSTGKALLEDMLRATPLGLRLTKDALNHAVDAGSLEAVVAMEDRNQILCAQSGDLLEGMAAFREKRLPRYTQSSSGNAPDDL